MIKKIFQEKIKKILFLQVKNIKFGVKIFYFVIFEKNRAEKQKIDQFF